MTFPGRGDLVPRRRRRRRGGARAFYVIVLLAALGVGGYAGWRLWGPDTGTPTRTAARICPTPSAPAAEVAAAPREVRLDVLNSTPRDGLAASVAGQLRSRGFAVGAVTNVKPPVTGTAEIRYGAGAEPAARLVAEHVPGARLVAVPQAGVRLVLGAGFHALATPAQAQAAHTRDSRAATPSPVPGCVPAR